VGGQETKDVNLTCRGSRGSRGKSIVTFHSSCIWEGLWSQCGDEIVKRLGVPDGLGICFRQLMSPFVAGPGLNIEAVVCHWRCQDTFNHLSCYQATGIRSRIAYFVKQASLAAIVQWQRRWGVLFVR